MSIEKVLESVGDLNKRFDGLQMDVDDLKRPDRSRSPVYCWTELSEGNWADQTDMVLPPELPHVPRETWFFFFIP